MSYEYLALANYGDQVHLDFFLENRDEFIDWTEENFEYVRYNPRKDINRYGLSITSLDGGLSGKPDLDSLGEYNRENNTNYRETDFSVPTPVYHHPAIQYFIEPWKDYIYRTHILKLESGGYFPGHRDSRELDVDAFRLIVPLRNCNPPSVYFIVDNKILNWYESSLYFVNTSKAHTLFNASSEPSYWIVLNVLCNHETATKVIKYAKER